MIEPSSMCGRKSVPISRYAASETTRSRARAPAPALPWATNHSTARPWAGSDRGGARGRSAPRRKPKRLTATGTASAAMKNETTSASAIVSASGRKNAPTTPDSAANGRRITIVDRLEPTSAGASSRMPRCLVSALAPGVVPLDVLDHDDRVVGDQPYARGDARERHQVDRLS